MQRGVIVLREAHAVLVRHHLIMPAMYQRGRAVEPTRAQLRQSLDVERRRHEKDTARVQQRGGGDRHVATEARADQHQIPRELLAEVHQACHAGARLLDAAVVDRVRLVPFRTCDLRQRGNLASPGTSILAVGEHDMTGGNGRVHGRLSYARRMKPMRE
jgi:hypothetical protein